MIRPSQLVTLVVVGAVLVGAGVWLVERQNGNATDDAQGPVLALRQQDLNAVTRLRVFKGDGSHTTLTRDATHWKVDERGYAADSGQVRKLLLDLSALQIEEQKTEDPALYPKLGVEDPTGAQATGTGLDIDLNGKTLGLIVGRTYGTRSVYLRVPGQARSVLATPQIAPDADPRHWLDRTFLDIAPERIAEVDVKPQSGPAYTLKRVAGDFTVMPIPKGRELADPAAASTQAGGLAGLQLDDVRKPAGAAPVAQVTFVTSDGVTIVLAGIQDAEQRYLSVTAAGSTPAAQAQAQDLSARLTGWQFQVPGYRYEALFRPLEQLLKPKASTPAAGASSAVEGPTPAGRLPFGPRSSPANPDQATPQQSR